MRRGKSLPCECAKFVLFVPVNCGALPDSRLESELFRHRRGAFTDAKSNEPGLVECTPAAEPVSRRNRLSFHHMRADHSAALFAEWRVPPGMGERPLRIADVRIVAATNVSLRAAVEAGHFRHATSSIA
ncbi:MAG: sigma 54-interacting transcriptional regulator [Xanthomonadales bacterium]|nr:sigma 54-interacting transcriptional regulator [Xanthomonadales bacterium]